MEKYIENKDEPILYRVEWYEDGDLKRVGYWYSWKLSKAQAMAEKKRKQGKIRVEIRRDKNGVWVCL